VQADIASLVQVARALDRKEALLVALRQLNGCAEGGRIDASGDVTRAQYATLLQAVGANDALLRGGLLQLRGLAGGDDGRGWGGAEELSPQEASQAVAALRRAESSAQAGLKEALTALGGAGGGDDGEVGLGRPRVSLLFQALTLVAGVGEAVSAGAPLSARASGAMLDAAVQRLQPASAAHSKVFNEIVGLVNNLKELCC